MDLNRVILIGRLANDPELKYTPSGIAVTSFRLAVNRPMSAEARTNGQEKQADFINIVAWRQSAEFAANYLGKGRLVAVEGQLHIREFEHQGQKRREAEVVVDNLKSLDRAKEGEEGASGGEGGYNRASSGGGYNNGGRGGRGGDYADADPGGDTGYGDEAPAAPAPARAPAANRPAAAPARPAPAAAPRPAAGGARYQPPADDDMDDPFADN